MTRTVMRTLLFAVHKPSGRTAGILKRSLRTYTQACRLVAEGAEHDWSKIAEEALYNGRLSTLSLERTLRGRYGERVAPAKYPLHSSAREAVFADIAAALSSYAALTATYERDRERALAKITAAGHSIDPPSAEAAQILDGLGDPPSWPSVPVVRPRFEDYEATLRALRTLGPGLPKPPVRLSETLAHGTRPLFFPRSDAASRNRNFGLLRTAGHDVSASGKRIVRGRRKVRKDRPKRVLYRALLYLLPARDARMRPLAVPPQDDGWDPLVPLQPIPEGLSRKRLAEVAPSLLSEARLGELAPALAKEQAEHILKHGLCAEHADALVQAGQLSEPAAEALLRADAVVRRLVEEGVTRERSTQLAQEGVLPPEEAEAVLKADAGRQQVRALMQQGVARSTRPSPALLLPLECGKWHEQTLDLAVANPEMVRAARLIHRPARIMAGGRHVAEKFFLAITFEHPVPDLRITESYMGVCMDESARVGYVVREIETGHVLASGTLEDLWGVQEHWRQLRRAIMAQGKLPPRRHHRQREQVHHAVHKIVNTLLEVADQYAAQVAITDVRYLRLRRPFLPRDPATGKRQGRSEAWHDAKAEAAYRRACLVVGDMERIYNYKCLQIGLPQALSIGGISPRDCAHCGGRGDESELCDKCGEPLGAQNTAHVTANRIPVTLEKIREARAKRKKEREDGNGEADNGPSDNGPSDNGPNGTG